MGGVSCTRLPRSCVHVRIRTARRFGSVGLSLFTYFHNPRGFPVSGCAVACQQLREVNLVCGTVCDVLLLRGGGALPLFGARYLCSGAVFRIVDVSLDFGFCFQFRLVTLWEPFCTVGSDTVRFGINVAWGVQLTCVFWGNVGSAHRAPGHRAPGHRAAAWRHRRAPGHQGPVRRKGLGRA